MKCAAAVAALLLACAAAGCSSKDSAPPTTTGAVGHGGPCGIRKAPDRAVRHVVWVVLENRSYDDVIGAAGWPYVNALAAECGLATDYHGIAHPSLPNYLALTSGSTHHVTDDASPAEHQLDGPSIFSQLGDGWQLRAESMPANCSRTTAGPYAPRHNPALYYTNLRDACRTHDVPGGVAASARFTFVTPNLCYDGHDCASATVDSWLHGELRPLLATSDFRRGRTVVFVTWDEADEDSANHVPLLVLSAATPRGARLDTRLDHFSLLATTEALLGAPCLGDACSAPQLGASLGL